MKNSNQIKNVGSASRSTAPSWLIPLVVFALVIGLLVYGLAMLSKGNAARQEENLDRMLTRTITTCYAQEGRYPESLEYLEENYGLDYNKKIFYVDYRVIGSNLRPDYTIIRRDGKAN